MHDRAGPALEEPRRDVHARCSLQAVCAYTNRSDPIPTVAMPIDQTWIAVCGQRLDGHPLSNFVMETLHCFNEPFPRSDGPHPPELRCTGDWEPLVLEHASAFDKLAAGAWQSDVDPAQARLFVRRLQSVDALLLRLADHQIPAAVIEVLQLGLRVRMTQIMALGIWPAVRLRALADFYYSRGVLLLHGLGQLDPAALHTRAAATTWQPVTRDDRVEPGLWQSKHHGSEVWGPRHITMLKIDLRHHRLKTMDLRDGDGSHDQLSMRLAALGAVAGSSGGFFLYSEPDIAPPSAQYDPVGMILSDKNISYPPMAPRAALLFADASAELRRVGLSDVSLRCNGTPLRLSEATIRAVADVGPDAISISLVGATVHQVGHRLPVPLNGLVLPWSADYGEVPAVGAVLNWSGPSMSDGRPAEEGLSGGPMLVADGEVCIDYRAEGFWGSAPPLTFSQDETGDRNLLARLVIGTDAEGFVYLVAADGRQVDRALGLSLEGCAAWMRGLGCTRAANMDGGSSKRLMLHGQVMDKPTTEVAHATPSTDRLRPVYSGLAVIPR